MADGDQLRFKRVLLKVSGEALMGDNQFGIDPGTVDRIANEIKGCNQSRRGSLLGHRRRQHLPRNFRRSGRSRARHRRLHGHARHCHERAGDAGRAGTHRRADQGAVGDPMATICEPFIRRRAIRHMEKGRVVIFAAGTGSPYFTTDTAAALRATEMNCDGIFKGTQVNGVYSADPKQEPDAERFDTLTYMDVLSRTCG